ncbi:MAG: putative toxin-antitoxin system toxin component, PIN family [Pseudomonadota bacterium]
MRVVVDTNVWISGLISPAGSPARVVQAVMDGQIIPVFSKATFAELHSVLVRPKISRFLTRSSVDVKAFLGNLETIAEFVEAPRGTSSSFVTRRTGHSSISRHRVRRRISL